MRFVDYVDYGDAPTCFATGVASVTILAPDVLEIALYRTVQLPNGENENRIVSRTIWAREQWAEAGLVAAQARAALRNGATRDPGTISKSH